MISLRLLTLIAAAPGLILLLAGTALGQPKPEAGDFYVATNGNDAWSGKLAAPNAEGTDGPFATVIRARDAVRQVKANGVLTQPVTVLLRGGLYCLPETLTFGPEDSGTEACPVTYKSSPGETVLLSGGRVITGWSEVPGAEPRAWTAQLPEVKAGAWNFRQLFVQRQGEPFFTRRFRPTTGMKVVADYTWSPARKTASHRAAQDDFIFFPGDLQRWSNLDDVEVVALHSWSASRLRIANLDPDKRIVKFTAMPTFRIGCWYRDGRNPYYAENVREELKQPGQWYLDRPSGTLTYLPLPGETPENTTIVAPRLERLISITGDLKQPQFVENLRFEGLGFLHGEWPLPLKGYDTSQGQPALSSAVEVTAGRRVSFTRCMVANTGAYGIGLGLGCQSCAVTGCLMYDLGGGGVKVGDSAMSQTASFPLLPTDNAVENNLITDTGLIHYSANGIWCGIVKGTRIRHNEVRNNPYTGIAVGWCWGPTPTSCGENLIERNHVHDVMQLVQDGGGIYTLGRQPGTIVRGNLVHDNQPSPFACENGQTGLYFDEGSSGFLVEDNIQYNIAWHEERLNLNQNTLKDHVIRNNFLGIKPADPAFPKDIAAQAGVEPAFAWPLSAKLRVTPDPVHSMTMPVVPPAPVGFSYDFEEVPVGEMPHRFSANGASGKAQIAVSDEAACTGKHSLKFQDQKGLGKTFYPYLSYSAGQAVAGGPVELSFDMRQDPAQPAPFWVELRDYHTQGKGEYFAGPSLGFLADGKVMVNKREVAVLPPGEWSHVSLTFALGQGQPKEFELKITPPDKAPLALRVPFASPDFQALTGLIVSADGDADGAFFLDNLKLGVQE